MYTLEIDTKRLTEYLQKDVPGYEAITLEELGKLLDVALKIFENEVAVRTPVNFGTLRQSVQGTRTGATEGLVTTNLIYGEPMERGRQPGRMPPVEALELWVIRKQIAPAEEARGVAWAIAKAIARGATRHQRKGGDKMFQQGFEAGKPVVEKLADEAIDRLIVRFSKQ